MILFGLFKLSSKSNFVLLFISLYAICVVFFGDFDNSEFIFK